jgi:hypothetical protein
MTDILQQATELSFKYEAEFMTWGPVVVLLILALILSYTALRNWLNEQYMYRCVRRLGVAAIRNIALPDGMDGRVLIENIILTPGGIYILPIKRYCGIIFAADNIGTWSQVVGKRSYKFSNPLPELDAYVMAVRTLLPAVSVEGRILVTNDADFPKGKPERIIPVSKIQETLAIDKGEVSSQLRDAWEKLAAAGLKFNAEEKKALKHFDAEGGSASQHLVSISLICVALGWLMWRLWG